MTDRDILPKEIGVCKFMDGTFDVYPDCAGIPPSTKYTRLSDDDIVISRKKLEALKREMRDPVDQVGSIKDWYQNGYDVGNNAAIDIILANE